MSSNATTGTKTRRIIEMVEKYSNHRVAFHHAQSFVTLVDCDEVGKLATEQQVAAEQVLEEILDAIQGLQMTGEHQQISRGHLASELLTDDTVCVEQTGTIQTTTEVAEVPIHTCLKTGTGNANAIHLLILTSCLAVITHLRRSECLVCYEKTRKWSILRCGKPIT